MTDPSELIEYLGITQRQYAVLLAKAQENLPTDTAVGVDEVDAILCWVLPLYRELIATEPTDEHEPCYCGHSARLHSQRGCASTGCTCPEFRPIIPGVPAIPAIHPEARSTDGNTI